MGVHCTHKAGALSCLCRQKRHTAQADSTYCLPETHFTCQEAEKCTERLQTHGPPAAGLARGGSAPAHVALSDHLSTPPRTSTCSSGSELQPSSAHTNDLTCR